MLYPSVDKLLKKVNSKYRLVHAVSKRAKMILEDDEILVDNPKSAKEVGIALEEINDEKVVVR